MPEPEEEQYGIASADFPITFYDRPQFMFSNLLRGDVDGATRAMLSPSTMTPSQVKTVQDLYAPATKRNKVLKTILEISTNPLVIAGLVLSLKYPLGSTKALLTLREGLVPKGAAMSKMFSSLHDAQFNLRTIPGLFEKLNGVVMGIGDFTTRWGDKANRLLLKSGKISRAEGAMVAAQLDGLHKTDHYMVKILQNTPEWKKFFGTKDVPIAAGLQSKMRPEVQKLTTRARAWFSSIRNETMSDPKKAERIKRAVEMQGHKFGDKVDDYWVRQSQYNKYQRRILRGTSAGKHREYLIDEAAGRISKHDIARTGGLFISSKRLQELETLGAVPKGFMDEVVEPYLARQSAEATRTASKIWDDVSRLGVSEIKERDIFIREMRKQFKTKKGFLGHLGSDKAIDSTLDAMAMELQDVRTGGPQAILNELQEVGRTLSRPGEYDLDLWKGMGNYLSSISNSQAWHGTGLGREIMRTAVNEKNFSHAPHLQGYLLDNLIPHVRGIKTHAQLQRDLSFSVQKAKIHNWIKESPFVESALGSKTKNWLMDYFGKAPNSISAEGLNSKISHMFYLSTLGANISPASKNLMQNFITTTNLVGMKGMWYGVAGIGKHEGALVKVQRYVGDVARGVPSKDAFRKAFPEYVKDMGEGSKILESLMAGEMEREGYVKFLGPKGLWDKTKQAMLMPFSTSEAFNRITGYYAGRNTHIYNNARKLAGASAEEAAKVFADAGRVGQSLTMVSHFTGGPLALPKGIMSLPSAARQYMMFPLRYLGFLHGSLRMGADPNKLNWGTIGRTLAGSTSAYIAGRNLLGLDLSSSLMTGAMPIPSYENSPFYPWPLVPPAASVAGTAAKALISGDTQGLGAATSMLIPGGVGIRRAYKSLSPRYADYDNQTPDGRVPIYNSDKALIGTLSPMQMFLRSVGIRTSDASAEVGASEWVAKNRDRIREYRREYLEALASNDVRRADGIHGEFKKAYPELGDIRVKKSDLRAIKNRRETTRVNRIAKGLPTAYRPIFSQILGDASMSEMIRNIQSTAPENLSSYIQ